jgi:hypothetical protein
LQIVRSEEGSLAGLRPTEVFERALSILEEKRGV